MRLICVIPFHTWMGSGWLCGGPQKPIWNSWAGPLSSGPSLFIWPKLASLRQIYFRPGAPRHRKPHDCFPGWRYRSTDEVVARVYRIYQIYLSIYLFLWTCLSQSERVSPCCYVSIARGWGGGGERSRNPRRLGFLFLLVEFGYGFRDLCVYAKLGFRRWASFLRRKGLRFGARGGGICRRIRVPNAICGDLAELFGDLWGV